MGTSPEKKQSPGTNAGVGTGTDNKISNLTGIENGQCTKPSIYDEGANGKRVGHIYIKSSKLGVIIDYSGGSKNSIDLARTQVKRFGNVTIKEMRGCAIGTGAHNDGQQGNIMPTVKTLISEKVDAIYWMCDLQDKEIPESVAALKTLLLDNHIKLYVYMTTQYDSAKNREAVIDIVKATGGALEYMTGHGVTIIK